MDILSYLTELIKTRKEVGIVGLGTIYKKKSPGRYDAATHSFLPPSYVIDFAAEVRETTALAEFVSKSKNLSDDSAVFYVDEFATGLQKELQEHHEVSLGELGILTLSEGNLIFIPGSAPNTGFEFYGLPQVKEAAVDEVPALTETIEVPEEVKELDEQPVYEEISETIFTPEMKPPVFVETIEGLDEHDQEGLLVVPFEDKPVLTNSTPHLTSTIGSPIEEELAVPTESTPKSGVPAYVLVIIAGVAVLAIVFGIYFYKPELFKSSAVNNSFVVADSTSKADTTVKIDTSSAPPVVTAPDGVIQDTTALAATPVAVDSATTWEVVGASVISQKEADWAIEQFRRIGIIAKVIPAMPGKRRIKISVATFSDEASARAGRKDLVKKLKNPELYIFQNKHTHK